LVYFGHFFITGSFSVIAAFVPLMLLKHDQQTPFPVVQFAQIKKMYRDWQLSG